MGKLVKKWAGFIVCFAMLITAFGTMAVAAKTDESSSEASESQSPLMDQTETVIEIVAPVDASEITEDQPVVVSAKTTGNIEKITAVKFYSGEKEIAEGIKETADTWTGIVNVGIMAAGSHTITAAAYIEESEAAVSSGVTITITEAEGAVVSTGKPVNVSAISSGSAATITDGNTVTPWGVWFINGTSEPSKGAWAEIDLEGSYLISGVKVYSGQGGDIAVSDFTIYYRSNGEWIDAAAITGNTNDPCECLFEKKVKTDGIRFVCNMENKRLRVREIEVMGIPVKADAPIVTVSGLTDGKMNVFENTVTFPVTVNANGSTIQNIGAKLNYEQANVTWSKNDNEEYSVIISQLLVGKNTVNVYAENAEGTVGRAKEFTVIYYSSDMFVEELAKITTTEELGAFILDNIEMLGLEGDDYTNLEKYERIYRDILSEKETVTSISDFLALFQEKKSLDLVRNTSGNELISVLEEQFPEIDVTGIQAESDSIQASFVALMYEAEYSTAEELEKCVQVSYALSKIKYTPWNGLTAVLADFHECLDLDNYADYEALGANQSYANQIIANYKTSELMDTRDGFYTIFSDAIAKAKENKNHIGGGGAPSRPSGSGGREGSFGGSSLGGGSFGVSTDMNDFKVDTNQFDYYTDVDQSYEAWSAIAYMTKMGVVQGVGNKEFLPDATITREEVVKILIESLFEMDASANTNFEDVAKNSWYYSYVATAQKLNLVKGISDSLFGSGNPITREELATLVYRAAKVNGIMSAVEETGEAVNEDMIQGTAGVIEQKEQRNVISEDEKDISTWAYYPIYVLKNNGILKDENIRPQEFATRAETVQLLYKIILMEE